jgi:hypothetical protein
MELFGWLVRYTAQTPQYIHHKKLQHADTHSLPSAHMKTLPFRKYFIHTQLLTIWSYNMPHSDTAIQH